MKNFDWTKFSEKMAISAPMDTIYKAWTTQDELEKWFLRAARFYKPDGTQIGRKESIQPGMTYEWEWLLYDILEKGNVNRANGKDHLQFTFGGECIVDVKLSTQYEYTIVELTQSNIPTDDESKEKLRLGCYWGWSFYLVNLKSVYEGGLDLRGKDERLKPNVNN
jgi:hypothetical protein